MEKKFSDFDISLIPETILISVEELRKLKDKFPNVKTINSKVLKTIKFSKQKIFYS